MEAYKELEKKYAEYIGTEYAITTNSGTSALHLALASLGIKEGDEVIVPNYTMIASAWAVTYTGATPVFAKSGDDLLMDVKSLVKKITPRTKAIMPVHIYGRVCDMDAIMDIADKYNLRVVEDACEAQGATYKGKKVGSFDIGVFSFYQNKIIPAEEGGIITTNDEKVALKAQFLKNMAFTEAHDYYHPEIGFNYRMPNLEAKLALENLAKEPEIQAKRFQIEKWYDKYLDSRLTRPKRDVVWVYDCKHPKAEKLVRVLNVLGVNARMGFKIMEQQPMYYHQWKKYYEQYENIFYLPVNTKMTEQEVRDICKKIDTYIMVL